jgi:hypothetical protein
VFFTIYVCEIANVDNFPHFTESHCRLLSLMNVENELLNDSPYLIHILKDSIDTDDNTSDDYRR